MTLATQQERPNLTVDNLKKVPFTFSSLLNILYILLYINDLYMIKKKNPKIGVALKITVGTVNCQLPPQCIDLQNGLFLSKAIAYGTFIRNAMTIFKRRNGTKAIDLTP